MSLRHEPEEVVLLSALNPHRVKHWVRDLRHKLNLMGGAGVEDWVACWIIQEGCCALCGLEAEFPDGLVIDHDHETDEFRGLLCNECNIVIEQVEITKRIRKYLSDPPARRVRQRRIRVKRPPKR